MLDSHQKHDLLNETSKLKQIILLMATDGPTPFAEEELRSDAFETVSKIKSLLDDFLDKDNESY